MNAAFRCHRGERNAGERIAQSSVIPGWSEGPDPESRDSLMCNCTSWFALSARPEWLCDSRRTSAFSRRNTPESF